MVLMGERGAEQRHDPVAHYPVDHALIVMDGFEHVIENGIEESLRLLGSRSAMILRDPTMSANRTVTCLRSPSRSPSTSLS